MISAMTLHRSARTTKGLICSFCFAAGLALTYFATASWYRFAEERSALDPSRRIDYEMLVAIPDDTHVIDAASKLYARGDVASVEVKRGPADDLKMSIKLRKDEIGFGYNYQRMAGYLINVRYTSRSVVEEDHPLWMHALYCDLLGLGFAIIFFSIVGFKEILPKYDKGH